jgi:hypothetical protein
MAHPRLSIFAACGRPRCFLPDEKFRSKMSDLYKQAEFEANARPQNQGSSILWFDDFDDVLKTHGTATR